jgi:hypothetical protein
MSLLALLLGLAYAQDVVGVPRTGTLHHGRWTEVIVAGVGSDGEPLRQRPDLQCDRGAVAPLARESAPGTSLWWVLPDERAGKVRCRAAWGATVGAFALPVGLVESTPLDAAERAVGLVSADAIRVEVAGTDLVPEALQVVTSEGSVRRVHAEDDRLVVEVTPDEDPVPRVMLLGLRDRRRASRPRWTLVRLKARLEQTVRTEPGATVSVRVGDRTYGPVVVDETGMAKLKVEQYPEEQEGVIEVSDDVGNTTRRTFQMSSRRAARLVPFVSGPRYPGEPPPTVWLTAIRGDGRRWTGPAPTCRTPRLGDLPLVAVPEGWMLQLPRSDAGDAWEVRVRCVLADVAVASFSVPLADAVPVGMNLRVWPEVLSADFPLADVAVSFNNAIGERIPVVGDVDLTAEYGTFEGIQHVGPVVRAEYLGDLAAEVGEDQITATWTAPPGEGVVDRLEAVVLDATGAKVRTAVRTLDALRRPLEGIRVTVEGAAPVEGVTDAQGWAVVDVPVPNAATIVRLSARTRMQEVTTLGVRGTAWQGGPLRPDLQAGAFLNVDPGRVADVDIQMKPPQIATGPGGRSEISVRFLDRSGLVVEEREPEVTVDAGQLIRASGNDTDTHVFRYIAPRSFRERDVEVSARSLTLDVAESRVLRIRSKPPRYIFGVSGGLQSNLIELNTARINVHGEFRIPVGDPELFDDPPGPSRFMLRAGIGWYGSQQSADISGTSSTVRMDLFPITFGFLLRQEYATQAFWVGGLWEVVPYRSVAQFQTGAAIGASGALAGGGAFAGYGIRIPSGEVGVELRGSFLTSPAATVGFEGPVGGLSALLTYRLLL